jgi:hypothetical protein
MSAKWNKNITLLEAKIQGRNSNSVKFGIGPRITDYDEYDTRKYLGAHKETLMLRLDGEVLLNG